MDNIALAAGHHVASVLALLPQVDDPTTYGPADLTADLTTAVVQVLPYVGAAVGATIGIMFALVGIKKGISWARSLTSRG